jgi:hypothetical protein
MKFRFADAATDELEEAINYSRANFGLGDELNAAVKNAITIIMEDPLRFPKRRDGLRSFNLTRFPYILIFQPASESGTVIFYAFAHTSRRPGYWKSRIPPYSLSFEI